MSLDPTNVPPGMTQAWFKACIDICVETGNTSIACGFDCEPKEAKEAVPTLLTLCSIACVIPRQKKDHYLQSMVELSEALQEQYRSSDEQG